MGHFIALIVALVRIFLPALKEAAQPRYEDALPNAELREKLKKKVRSAWGEIGVRFEG